jgi:hypothetical protein
VPSSSAPWAASPAQPVVPQAAEPANGSAEVVAPVVSSLAGRGAQPATGAPVEGAAGTGPFGTGVPDAVRESVSPDGDDDHEERPRHPYTWLHLIVLALVAFVLGFLIVLLLAHTTDDATGDGSGRTGAQAPATVVAPTT